MKKESEVKPLVCTNGHASTPNGRADDEGGGATTPRVSYAAAARKPTSPQGSALPFPLNTGKHAVITTYYPVYQQPPRMNSLSNVFLIRRNPKG